MRTPSKPIGPMSNAPRKREDQNGPAFAALMVRHGFLPPRSSPESLFGMWVQVCEDIVVRERSNARMARKRPGYIASFAAGYGHVSAVLNAMTPREIQQLRERLHIQPAKRVCSSVVTIKKKRVREMKREVRFAGADLRAVKSNGEMVISGRPAVFNSLSQDLGGFKEALMPGCFDESLNDR